jgi:hypothetical protein
MTAYNHNVCLGNWFEDRVQGASEQKQGKRVIVDYGYRIFETDAARTWGKNPKDEAENKVNTRARRLERFHSSGGVFKMAQPSTYDESTVKRVSSRVPEDGFEAILPPASQSIELHAKSNNQYAFGLAPRESQTAIRRLKAPDAHFAGSKPIKREKSNQPQGLSGEVWKDGSDPQNSTLTQRAWMYAQDPAIHYKLNGYPVLKPEDVECTGLQIGSEHLKSYDPNANYRRNKKTGREE